MPGTIQQSLNAFSVAFLAVVLALFVFVFPPTGTICNFGPPVRVPWSASSVVVSEAESDLEIRITRDDRFFIGPNVVRRDQLEQAMREIADRTSTNRAVHISADAACPYVSVESALRAASQAGFRNISLITFTGTTLEMWQHDLPSNSALHRTPTASPSR